MERYFCGAFGVNNAQKWLKPLIYMAANFTLSTLKNHFMRNIFKPLLFLAAFFVSAQVLGQVNITPIRTDVSGFATWTDATVTGTTYIQLLQATSSTISPAMNFDNFTNETLDFTARTFGGTNATENTVTVSISTDNGSNWTVLGTRTPTTTTLTAMTQFNISGYSGTQVRIRFTVAGINNTIGVGIDDVSIRGIAAATPAIALSDNGTQVAIANVTEATTNHVLHRFRLDVTTANASLTAVACTTAGGYEAADITNLKVRYSTDATLDGADATLSTLTSPGAAGAKTFPSFTAQAINSGSTGYIFITADIAASSASGGNTISVNAIATGDLTFAAGTKSGSTNAGGTQTIVASATPSITVTETPTAFSTTYGTASAVQTFTVTGANLSGGITATAPTGFLVSSDGTTYGATASFPAAGGSLRVRLAATAAAGTYNNQNIALTSGATTQNITTTASGNVVNQKALTITGLSAANRVYDATTNVSVTGTPQYVGLENGETFSVSGLVTWAHANKNIGTGKTLNRTGSYAAPSANYTVTQPTLTANITVATLTVSSPTATGRPYNGLTTVTVGGTLSGVFGGDVVNLSTTATMANATSGNNKALTFTISGTDAGNYTLTQPGTTVNIAKVTLTATADNKNKNQGDANPALTITYTGFVNSETVAAITAPSISTTALTASPIGTYPITLTGGSATNYDITLVNGTLTIITGPCEATGFEGSTSVPTNWSGGSGSYVQSILANANTGNNYSGFNTTTNGWISTGLLTDPQSVSFYARASGTTSNFTVVVQYSDDNTNWSNVPSGSASANGSNTGSITTAYQLYNYSLNLTGNYYIRWTMSARTGGSYYFDDVAIYCTPPAADINVLGNGVSIADVTTATGVANHTEFAATPVNGTSTRTFTIQNSTGIGTINLTGTPNRVTLTGSSAFSVTTQPALSALTTGGNQSTTFVVTFSPTNTTNQTATITIVNDDPDTGEQTYTFNVSGTGTNSQGSDIVVTGGFSYATNINYASFTSNDITSGNSVVAGGFTLRDGGATTDADAVGTTLSAITFSLSNFANIQKVALYDGATELQEVAAAASVTFNAAALATNLTTADDGTKNFTLRVTFNTSVTDNQQFQFTVTAATAVPAGSGFAAGNAGGATTSVAGNNNKIIVTADRLRFTTQPIDGAVNVNLSQFTVSAVDANFNVDADATNSFTLTTLSGSNYTSGSPYALTNGFVNINNVQYSAVKTNETLTAATSPTPGVLTSATSNPFSISNTVYPNGAYLSTSGTGSYATASNWCRCINLGGCAGTTPGFGNWGALGANGAPNATSTVYVQGTITQGTATGATNATILSGGNLILTANYPVSSFITVKTGGRLDINAGCVFTPAVAATFVVENNADVYVNTAFSSPPSQIWNGIENFYPESNLYINNWDVRDYLVDNDVTQNLHNGYTAAFGNVYIDAKYTGNAYNSGIARQNWDMLSTNNASPLNLTHGNFEFVNAPYNNFSIAGGAGSDGYKSIRFMGSEIGTYVVNIRGDLKLNSTWVGTAIVATKGNFTLNVTGDVNINSPGALWVRASLATGNTTLNIAGNLLMNGSGTTSATRLFLNQNSYGLTPNGNKAIVNLSGNLTVGANPAIVSSCPSADAEFNFTGTSEVDVASVLATGAGNGIPFSVKNGATARLKNNNLSYTNGSSFKVEAGGILDFNWSSTNTPLIISQPTPITGTNTFTCEAGGELYITSLQGIVKNTANAGNVQLSVANKTFNAGGYYRYTGKANQVTGEGLPTTLTNGRLIVDMNTATLNLNLTASTAINGGQLGLVRGLLLLDDKNITLNATATVTGTPSASNMVVTNNTGQFFKTYSGASTFTYPLGDNTGTIEYSPVALTFTGAVSGNVGARVTDAVHPNMGTVANYLSRFWSFTNTLTNYNYTAVFTYPAADAVGTMTNVKASRYSGSGTTWSSISGSSATTTALTITTSQDQTTSPLTSDYTGREACVVGTWTGAQNSLWENVNNWSCLTVPTSTTDVTIPNTTNDPVIVGTVTANTRNILVESGALFTITGDLNIYGNYTNNGASVSGEGKIVLTAGAAQTISGNFTIAELELNNSNGASLLTGSDVNLTEKLTLTLGTLTTTNGNLVLKSNNTRTAYVDDFNDVSGVTNSNTGITGNLTIERYIKPTAMLNYTGRFHYIGGLTTGNASKWSDNFSNAATSADNVSVTPKATCDPEQLETGSAYGNLLSFDESAVTNCNLRGWKVRTTAATADRGRGFAAQITGGTVLDETGGYNNSSLTLNTLSITGNNLVGAGVNAQNLNNSKGEHLVANPFWAPLDWSKVTGTGLDGTAYRYNPNTGTFNPFNGISGSNVFSTNEAFVILPTTAARNAVAPGNTGTYSIAFPATARVNSNNNEMLRSQQPYAYAMKVKVAANGQGDETMIAFDNTFTESYDDAKDAKKLMSSVGVPSLYTLDPSDNETRCILALPEATQVKTIPLSVRPQFNGTHEFTFEGLSDFPNTTIVWLEDLTTGTIQYLKQNNTYSFIANKTDNADRFLLHFAPEMVITATQANCTNENGSISLEERGGLEWSYELVDNNNATVSQNANFSGNQTIASLPSGTYTLNLNHTASGYQTTETVTIQQVATVAAEMVADNTTVNAGDMVTVDISNTTGATNTTIDMGDGTVYNNEAIVNHVYTTGGTYTVTLNANNDNCTDAASLQIRVEDLATSIADTDTKGIKVYANQNELYVEQLLEKGDIKAKVDIYNMLGQIVTSVDITATYKVPSTIILTDVAKGTYIAQVTAGKKTVSKRIVVGE
jgi:hypothetical protein